MGNLFGESMFGDSMFGDSFGADIASNMANMERDM
jgi:hypothetical protein